jgi:hypothetical protein
MPAKYNDSRDRLAPEMGRRLFRALQEAIARLTMRLDRRGALVPVPADRPLSAERGRV